MSERTVEVPAVQYAALVECYKQSSRMMGVYFNPLRSGEEKYDAVLTVSDAVNKVHDLIVTT